MPTQSLQLLPKLFLRKSAKCLFITCLLVASFACKKGVKQPETLTPLSEAELKTFSTEVVTAFQTCDMPTLVRLIDIESLARRSVASSKIPKRSQKGVLEEFGESDFEKDLLGGFCQGDEEDDEVVLIGYLGEGTTLRPIIRISSIEGVNYIELLVGKNKSGVAIADDIVSYLTGDPLSVSLTETFNSLVGNQSSIAKVQKVTSLLKTDPKKAFEEFLKLPEKVKNTKALQLSLVASLAAGDEALYQRAIKMVQKAFPGDPSIDLVTLDGFILQEKYLEASNSLERLDSRVGGDPYLWEMQGNVLVMGLIEPKKIRELGERLLDSHTRRAPALNLLLAADLLEGNAGVAFKQMNILLDEFELYEDAETLERFGEKVALQVQSHPDWPAYQVRVKALLSRSEHEVELPAGTPSSSP